MTCSPTRAPRAASASPTRRFKASDSTTQGPAMKNGAVPASKCRGMSAFRAGQRRGRFLRAGRGLPLAPLLQGGADEAGEQRVGPHGPGLELGMELTADEPRVLGELDHFDQRPVR